MPARSASARRVAGGLGVADGPVALKLRLGWALDTITLEPEGIPPSAILVVRRVADPLPRRLSSTEPTPARDWGLAMQSSLAGWYRRAERPAHGTVASGINAVLFADRAELLAALARDLVAGHARTRWWWTSIMRALPHAAADAILNAWVPDAMYIPAALQLLADWGNACDVLHALTPAQTSTLLRAVSQAHDIPAIVRRQASPRESTPAPKVSGLQQAAIAVPPWAGLLPAGLVPPSLGPERSALLGFALVLHRLPLLARSAGFARACDAWWQSAAPDSGAPTTAGATTPASSPATDDEAGARAQLAPSEKDSVDGDLSSVLGDPVAGSNRRGSPAMPVRSRRAASMPALLRPVPLQPNPAPTPAALPLSANGVSTELGGVLFLVNLFRALDLCRQLEHHFHVGSQVSGWAWVELFARSLLGYSDDHFANDPLWRVMAVLDGRRNRVPAGTGFVGRSRYLLPAAWMEVSDTQGGGTLSWCLHARRLELWHPGGYMVMARDLDGVSVRDALEEAATEFADNSVPPLRMSAAARGRLVEVRAARLLGLKPGPALRRFLEFLLPFVRWRLAAALRLDHHDADALVNCLLRRRGHLYATTAHVDLTMTLAEVMLPVRVAGLDFNPGWVPELARVITFRFV